MVIRAGASFFEGNIQNPVVKYEFYLNKHGSCVENREMYVESENKFGFGKFSFVFFLFSNVSYLKNYPRTLNKAFKCNYAHAYVLHFAVNKIFEASK